MSQQANVTNSSQDEQVDRYVLVVQCMKKIARNITANCIREGGYHKLIAAINPLCNSEWNPVGEDLGRLNNKINELYYTIIPIIEREEISSNRHLQESIDKLALIQKACNESKSLKFAREKKYKRLYKVPLLSGVYKDKYISAETYANLRENELWISRNAVMSCKGELSASKKLLFGLNNLLKVMVDAHSELEDVCLNKHPRY